MIQGPLTTVSSGLVVVPLGAAHSAKTNPSVPNDTNGETAVDPPLAPQPITRLPEVIVNEPDVAVVPLPVEELNPFDVAV